MKKILVAIVAVFAMVVVTWGEENPAITEWKKFDESLRNYTIEVCKEYEVPCEIIFAIMYNESCFTTDATGYNNNGTKDYGLMQLNDVTFSFLSDEIGIKSMKDLYDAKTNILAGVTIFRYHMDATDSEENALLRYQIGAGGYECVMSGELEPNDAYYNVLNNSKVFKEELHNNDILKIKSLGDLISEKVKSITLFK